MRFYDGQEENNKIIKDYFSSNKYIKVNYLNNESSITYNYTKEKEDEIINIMIEQAIKRDKELYDKIYYDTKIQLTKTLLSLLSVILSFKGNTPILLCISFIAYLNALSNLSESYKKLKELKKFRLFYSIKEELDKPENKDITKIIEFDPMYREPINIGTLNEFSYKDIKVIKKELKRRNKLLNKV